MRKVLGSLRRRLTYANVAATLALFLAMGGTAYAAATIGSAEIIDNSIQSADVKNGALTSLDVKNETLQSADIKDGSLTGADVADGSIDLGDLGTYARVEVQPFVVVLPVVPGSYNTVQQALYYREYGDISLHARCLAAAKTEAAVFGFSTGQAWHASLDGSVLEKALTLDFAADSANPRRVSFAVGDPSLKTTMLVFAGMSVAPDQSQCAFDGFAIILR
jgi:hypothetical protein